MNFRKFLNIVIFVFISLLFTACAINNQRLENSKKIYEKEPITQALVDEINQIALAIKEKNINLINNKYIHPINGYYNLIKFGNENIFEIRKDISEIDNYFDSFEIRYDKVSFNCSPYDDSFYGWDKEGIFINSQTKPYITKIMEDVNSRQSNIYKIEDIEKMDFIEQTSYEIIIPYSIIFYITKIDNHWYITLIDNATTDCSR